MAKDGARLEFWRLRKAASQLAVIAVVAIAVQGGLALAQNFSHADAELVAAAEAARVKSARYWSGEELPGRWSAPCLIHAQVNTAGAGGRTQFRFAQGEVIDWRMDIQGSRADLLRDVIPHEVDHMVRASLVRHPVERWLDEGCASLMESAEVHQQLRRRAAQLPKDFPDSQWLAAKTYPTGGAAQETLYAAGFSLVEFLLSRQSPQVLLELQRDDGDVEVRLQRRYGLSVAQLRTEWTAWRAGHASQDQTCEHWGCPLHAMVPAMRIPEGATSREILWVWTAEWCGPCRKFKADLSLDVAFRHALEQRFDVRVVSADQHPLQAQLNGVRELPTFCWAQGRISGYTSPEDLLQRLGLKLATHGEGQPVGARQLIPDAAQEPASGPIVIAPPPATVEQPAPEPVTPVRRWKWLAALPALLSVGQWAGVLGGTVATGGLGGLALAAGWTLARRWLAGRGKEGVAVGPWPFPRRLDEACELLRLRQPEGRVAALDALRGMFVDDELDKLAAGADAAAQQVALQLRQALNARIDEVAPLTTKVSG